MTINTFRILLNFEGIQKGLFTTTTLYIGSLTLQAHWRGVWGLADYYLKDSSLQLSLLIFLSGFILLTLLTSSRTLIFPPFIVFLDNHPASLVPSTRFLTQVGHILIKLYNKQREYIRMTILQTSQPRRDVVGCILHVLDCLFTHFFILPTSIITWRCGIFLVSTVYSDPVCRDVSCLVAGFALLLVLISFENLLARLAVSFASLGVQHNTLSQETPSVDHLENSACFTSSGITTCGEK